jgi:hypothetical protein
MEGFWEELAEAMEAGTPDGIDMAGLRQWEKP